MAREAEEPGAAQEAGGVAAAEEGVWRGTRGGVGDGKVNGRRAFGGATARSG